MRWQPIDSPRTEGTLMTSNVAPSTHTFLLFLILYAYSALMFSISYLYYRPPMLKQNNEGEREGISVVKEALLSAGHPVGMYSVSARMFLLQQTDPFAYAHVAANHYRSGGHARDKIRHPNKRVL